MEHELRFGVRANEDDARLIVELAARHDLDEALVRELLAEARRAEAADGQHRSTQYWFAVLLQSGPWRRPAPGARRTSAAQLGWYRSPDARAAGPGKCTWTDEEPPRYPGSTPAFDHQPVPGKHTQSAAFVAQLEAQSSALDPDAARPATTAMPTTRLAARAHDGISLEATRGLIERVFSIVTTSDAGAPLPGEFATRMKAELGGAGPDTSKAVEQARVHTDDAAAQAARLLGARAFTVGHHVYFDRGEFAPGTEQGDRLLRHELTHVAQHARGELAAHGALELVAESSATEAEARAAETHQAKPGHALQAPHADAARPGGVAPEHPAATGPAHERATATSEIAGAALATTASSPATTTSPATATPPAPTPPPAPTTPPAPATSLTAAPGSPVAPAPISRAPAPGGSAGTTGSAKGPALPVVDLFGKGSFEPPAAVAAAIDKAGPEGTDVRVKFGNLTPAGVIRVKKVDGAYVTDEATPQLVPLSHPLFVPVKGVKPVLRLRIGGSAPNAITGYVTLESAPSSAQALQSALIDNPELLGLRGFAMPTLAITNRLEAGTLTVGVQQAIPFTLGGWVDGQLQFGLVNSAITFDAHANVHAKGLQDGQLTLSRDARGSIKGSVALGVQLGDKFSGKATATYEKGDVVVKGQIGYHSEKLHGTLGIIVADADQAEQMVREQIDPSALAPSAGKGDAPSTAGKSGKRAIAGWGDLDFAFTDWLTGKAKVVYGPSGHITVIGKIAPPKQIDLMSRKGTTIPILPQFNIEARYGIPLLADVHVGIGVGLSATAGLGPIYMTDLAIDGIYSTDPAVLNRFSITGALRAQADAGLELTVRGYAGVTLLGHSVNFGAEVIGKAGLRAYAEARPTLGYRETAAPAAGKKGEYYLQGHLEMAAQPVLSLAGNLFVELDSPWWSPAGDHTWRWPIGSLEYPIPAQMGIGADVDYVIGSGKFPEIKLTKPDFNPSKFVDAMMGNNLPGKSGRDKQEQKGSFSGVPPARPTSAKPAVQAKPTPEPKAPSGGATKPGKGMQTPDQQKNVPANQQVANKWAAGMQALGDLRKRAEKDPEDSNEIKSHLATLKATHGFTQLTANRQGDVWAVHAAMNAMQSDVKVKAEKEGDGKQGKDDKQGKDGKNQDKKQSDSKQQIGARVTFQAHGETHTQYIDASGGAPVAMVASTPSAVKAKIEEWRPRLRELPDADQKRAGKLIGQAIAIEGKVGDLAAKVKAGQAQNSALEAKQRELANTLAGLFEIMAPDPAVESIRHEIREKLRSPLLRPGPYAKESIPATKPVAPAPAADQREIDRIGNKYGCHHTGVMSPGQAHWTGDHQPVTALVRKSEQSDELKKLMIAEGLQTTLNGQRLYPHSYGAYKEQGGTITAITLKLRKLEGMKGTHK